MTWKGVGESITCIGAIAYHPTRQLLFAILNEHMCSFQPNGELASVWPLINIASPHAVVVHPTLDLLFVANRYSVCVFLLDGTIVFKWKTTHFINGLAVDTIDNRVYLTTHIPVECVRVYTIEGHPVLTWLVPTPSSLIVHSNRVFVASNRRIRVFERDGTPLQQWKRTRRSTTIYLAIHPARNWLFVADSLKHRVKIYQLDGTPVKYCHHDRFDPRHIAVDPVRNVVYVVDAYDSRNDTKTRFIDAIELFPSQPKK